MFTTLCLNDDLSDFLGFLMPLIGGYRKWQQHQQLMSLGSDSWSADGNDYVNSACREKRKLIF